MNYEMALSVAAAVGINGNTNTGIISSVIQNITSNPTSTRRELNDD